MKAADRASPAPEPSHRRAALDASGRERPRFLLDYPENPELDRLIAAFESGDYARVRELASDVIEHATDPAVKDAARELRRRIDPDPTILYLLFVAIGLLLFLAAYAYSHPAH